MDRPSSEVRAEPALAPASARRRLLRAGLGGAPVILTLASRPVLGTQCVCPSAWSSLTGSAAARNLSSCSGKTPTTWASLSTWPDPYHPTTKMGSKGWLATAYHCTTTGLNGTTFSTDTMLTVMNLSDDAGMRTLGRYTAAALLNARSGLTPVLTEAMVRTMWNDLIAKTYFEPTAGVKWYAPDLIAYFKTTMA